MTRYLEPAEIETLFDLIAAIPEHELTNSTDVVVRSLRLIGVSPALVHAFETTGMLVSEETVDLWSAAELRRWDDALQSYRPSMALEGAGTPVAR